MKSKILFVLFFIISAFFSKLSAQCFIGSISPLTKVCTGETITINGSFAFSGTTVPRVTWGGTVCPILTYSNTRITATLPSGASGSSVTVRDKANCTANGMYAGIVYQTPDAPTSLSAVLTTINQGQSTTIFVYGGSAGETKWYTGGCGVGSVFSTNPVAENVSPSTTTTYYVRNEGLVGGCASPCKSVTITVIPGGGGGGGNTITTSTNISAGGTLYNGCNLNVPYTATGTFNPNNVFTAELSDPYGNFSSPTVIGSLAGTALSGSINAVIPSAATAGIGYRIRVVSNDPPVTGTDNGGNLSIGPITVGSLPSGTFCPGSGISIPFYASSCLSYGVGNVYTAQLSDAFGNFSNPYNIGSINSNASSGVITATIPSGVSSGSGYRVRVVSSNPAGTGLEYGTTLNIISSPTAVITPSGPTNICGGGSVILTASAGGTYQWSNGSTNQSIQVSQSGSYTVTVTYGNNCSAIATPVSVSVNPIPPTPTAWSNSPVRFGDTIKLNSSTLANATYHWTGPASFKSSAQNPFIPLADISMGGVYTVTDTLNGCGSAPASVTVELYGQVTGKIKTETNIGVKKTTVLAAGTPNLNYLTDMTGNYSFDLKAGSNYTITPFKSNDSIKNNGVTIADYSAVRNHIRGTRKLSTPYKIIAADVNSDGVVNLTDLDWIRKMINNQFGLILMSKLWSFVPHDYVFPNPQNPFPFPSSRTYTMTANRSTQDFIGMKLGDVNNTWDPNRSSTDTLELGVPDLTVSKDSDILVPVIANNFNVISAFQFTLQWDPNVLTYRNVDTTTGALKVEYGEDSVAAGKLSVLWIDADSSKTLADNTALFYVRFKATGNYNTTSPIRINSDISIVEALDSADENVAVKTEDGEVQINAGGPVSIGEFNTPDAIHATVSPNPFEGQTSLNLELPGAEVVNMEIYDLAGRKIFFRQKYCPAGKSTEHILMREPAGIYFIRLSGSGFSKTLRLVQE